MSDSISDLLTSIKNAQAVSKETVVIPFSNLCYSISQVLEKEGLVSKIEKKGKKTKKVIEITLRYEEKTPVISGIERISRPGQRIYIKNKEIRPIRGGYGLAIISTSKGLLTNKEAKKQKLGGELICEIW
ncbi:MAG: 30S ribosomal protein S8 [Candidatus Pacebacteria bacterium]|nr:30S ribosomal protein S8 [Candidatus Paceibacterota bacterium]